MTQNVRSQPAWGRLAVPAALIAAAGLAGPIANADTVDWIQPGTGLWNAGANWSTGAFPNNQSLVARILNGGTAEVNGTFALGGLHVGNGSTVRFLNGSRLNLHGNVANDGLIELTGSTSLTSFFIAGSEVTLAGNGEVRMSGSVNGNTSINRITGSNGNTLINDADHTIRVLDYGGVGAGSVIIDNRGLIVADGSGTTPGELLLDGRNNGTNVFNTGTFRAENGGTLSLSGSLATAIDNNGGVIEALDASTVRLVTSASIIGGTLRTEGTGAFRAVGGGHLVDNVDLDGRFVLQNSAGVTMNGVIHNAGEILLQGTNSLTQLLAGEELTLTGNGEVRMSGSVNGNTSINRIGGSNGNVLINDADHTIRVLDYGAVGAGSVIVDNRGFIVADGSGATPGELLLDGRNNGTNVFNTGTFRAENGGTLSLSGSLATAIDNNGGVIEALDASTVRLVTSASIIGGTLRTEGTGTFRAVGGGHLVDNVDLDGRFVLQNSAGVTMNGVIHNAGEILLQGTNSLTQLLAGEELTLTGNGEVRMSGSVAGNVNINRIGGSNGNVLINDADHTIRVLDYGAVGAGSIIVDNRGLIVADGSGATAGELLLDGRNNGTNVFNIGTFRAENGGTLSVSGSLATTAENAGVVEAVSGGTVRLVTNGRFINFDAPSRTLTGGAWVADNGTLNVAPTGFDLEISHADVTIRGTGAQTNLFDTATSAAGDIRSLRFRENHGEFTVAGGADFTTTLTGVGALENMGVFRIGSDSTVTITGDADTLRNQSGALFAGAGLLNAHLDSPGDVRVEGLATLAITGHAAIGGEFTIDLGATPGLLDVGGDLSFAGPLFINVLDDLLLVDGAEYVIAATAGELSGDFTALATNSTLYEFETLFDLDAGQVVLRSILIPAPGSIFALMAAGLVAARRRRD